MTRLIDATAVLDPQSSAWDDLWRRVLADDCVMPPPSPRVVQLADHLWRAGARHVLDLGCGPGRHAVFLAARGFHVYATDVSAEALAACQRALDAAGLRADLSQEPMIELSLPNKLVEWVLAENVLYHAPRADICQAISEVRRVLKPGGLLSATLISPADDKLRWYRHQLSLARAEEIEPNTFHALFRGPTDEHVPHTFLARQELPALFEGFIDLQIQEETFSDARRETAAYWHVLARKR